MAKQINHLYEFGSVTLDATNRLLHKDGEQLPVQPRVVETLLVLVQSAQSIVDKDTLLGAVWQGAIVEEGGLKRNISLLRKALGEDGRFIETLPKRGYRFTAEVKERWEETPTFLTEEAISEVVLERRASLRITHEEAPAAAAPGRTEVAKRLWPEAWRRPALALPASVMALLLAGLGFWWATSKSDAARPAPITSIAVLPFKNLAVPAQGEHSGVGMADVLITRLSNIKDLNVRPTNAVMKFNSNEQDPIAAGQALGVDAVLEGSMYRVHGRMRVTARLVRVSDQSPVWAGQFDEKADDFLSLQNAIAHQLVSSLSLNISRTEKEALAKRHTENADAYQLYVTGRYHWNKRNGDGVAEAERYFRKAIEKDPDFALAYLGLADTLTIRGVYDEPKTAIDKAIELDDRLGEAYASRGFWKMVKGWQWGEAEADFKRATELNPGYGTAHQWHATLLAITGRVEEAKAEMRRALEIDPTSHNFLADLGQMHYFAREYEQAESYCRKALAVYPDFGFAISYLKDIYLKKGEPDRAFEEEMKYARTNYLPFADSQDRIAQEMAKARAEYRRSGYLGWWRGSLERLLNRTTDFFTFHALVRNYTLLGEKEKALEALEKSCESRDFMLPFVHVDPLYDELRAEPRFQAVIRRLGLAR
jgi:DNA-binding winged helix-turn-helix (wHTH) protein/TolB-like protein/Flp pilus assembly protein TadD